MPRSPALRSAAPRDLSQALLEKEGMPPIQVKQAAKLAVEAAKLGGRNRVLRRAADKVGGQVTSVAVEAAPDGN